MTKNEAIQRYVRVEAENADLRADLEKVKKIAIAHMDKLPARLNTARMAGRNEANQSWEEGWEFGRKCEQQMKDENATFTAEIMKYEAELEAVAAELTDYKNKYATMAGEVDCRTLDMVRWKERAEQADLALHIANTDKARALREMREMQEHLATEVGPGMWHLHEVDKATLAERARCAETVLGFSLVTDRAVLERINTAIMKEPK